MMQIHANNESLANLAVDALCIILTDGKKILPSSLSDMDQSLSGQLSLWVQQGDWPSKKLDTQILLCPYSQAKGAKCRLLPACGFRQHSWLARSDAAAAAAAAVVCR